MNWKKAYDLLIGLGTLCVIVSFFLPLSNAFILALPGAIMLLGALIERRAMIRNSKQPPQPSTIIKIQDVKPAQTSENNQTNFSPPSSKQPPQTQPTKPSFFSRFFKEKQAPPKKQNDIKIIEREEDKKITLLKRYVSESLTAGYPKEKILESALKSHWPQEMVDQILEDVVNKHVKKKLIIFISSFTALMIVLIVLAIQGLFILPYLFKIAGEASGLFYVGIVILIASVVGIIATRLRKVLKKKQVEYRIQETSHVEDIKEALKKFEGGYETDIDRFYALIVEKKRVTIQSVAQAFKVSEETAEDWARILVDQDLVELHYPTMGDPEVIWKSLKATKSL